MAKILEGKTIKEEIKKHLSKEVADIVAAHMPVPKLVIIRIGNNAASKTYIAHKFKFTQAIGAEAVEEWRDENVTTDEIVRLIEQLNADELVHGILVQMPIPDHLDTQKIINTIDSKKDVDGLGAVSMHSLIMNLPGLRPATVQGIITLCEFYKIELKGKRVLVIGRSLIVGKPLALELVNQNATVTIAHSHSKDIEVLAKEADIIMVATGQARLIQKEWVKPEHIIFDIGINREEEGLVGDVSEGAHEIVSAYTPVPGGVGQLTVASLLANLLKAYGILVGWKQ